MSRRAIVILGALLLLAGGYGLSAIDLRQLDAEWVAQRVRTAGLYGPLALFALLVLQCVVAPLPSEPLMMAAGFVYGGLSGFVIGWGGVILGASACFVLARRLGRPFAERFVRAERLAAIDAYVSDRGRSATFLTLLSLRLVAFSSFDILSYACGLVGFPFRWFLVATAVGVIPKVVAFTYLGANVGARPWWLDATIIAGTVGMLALVPWFVGYRRAAVATGSSKRSDVAALPGRGADAAPSCRSSQRLRSSPPP
jgi:uncharacterized membrane protein YdjX (TVP38/TMEM64 family)